jgi:DNA modification methylase
MVYLDLFQGDCLEVMKDLSANTIDCFICDLPYGCLTNGNDTKSRVIDFRNTKIEKTKPLNTYSNACAWDVKIDLPAFWEQVKRLARNEHTPVLMFCTTKFGNELINSNPSWFRYDLVWDKGRGVSFLSANKMPLRSHEMIYVFAKSGAHYQRVDVKGDYKKWQAKGIIKSQTYKSTNGSPPDENGKYIIKRDNEGGDGTRCVKSIVQVKGHQKAGQHPTEKPSELYKWLIERYSPAGGTVLDPTAGSFNSCFAAYELNRNAIGIEKDEKFYKKACEKADTL